MEGDSLMSLENHPHKLLIKVDSLENGNEIVMNMTSNAEKR